MFEQRCGAEVVVLEARDRVGGRVHSYTGSGFGAPVDLGASIVTGTEADPVKGWQPDPSSVIARYALIHWQPVGSVPGSRDELLVYVLVRTHRAWPWAGLHLTVPAWGLAPARRLIQPRWLAPLT
jgi:hypothetical protein